jgi:transcriptional regulator GlxA family with amidase domain
MRIEIVLFDGFDEIDAFGPFEVLAGADLDVSVVVHGRPRTVVSQRGLRLDVLESLGHPDGIVVPGGGWLNHAQAGSWAEVQRGDLPAALRERAADSSWVASVCTGAMILAATGLLEGRYATTNRNAFEELRPYVLDVLNERVVDHGDRVTAGGLTAGLDLGLHLVERTLGEARAIQRAEEIEYQRQGRTWYAPAVDGSDSKR